MKKPPSWWHRGSLTDDDVKKINKLLAKATREAIEKTWAAGRPVTYLKDGWIVREWPDHRIEKIKELRSEF